MPKERLIKDKIKMLKIGVNIIPNPILKQLLSDKILT